MPLGKSADGRIAGKMPYAIRVAGDEQHGMPQAGKRHGGLAAGVPTADDDAGITIHMKAFGGGCLVRRRHVLT